MAKKLTSTFSKSRYHDEKRHIRFGQICIVLPSDAHTFIPDGCTELFETDIKDVAMITDILDENDTLRDGQLQDTFAAASKHCSLVSKDKGNALQVTMPKGVCSGTSPFYGVWIHSGLECGVSDDSSGDEDTHRKPSKGRSGGKSSASQASTNDRTPVKSKKGVSDGHSTDEAKELHNARRLVLDAVAQIRLMGTVAVGKTSLFGMQKLKTSITAWLDSEMAKTCGSASSSPEGAAVLAELKEWSGDA